MDNVGAVYSSVTEGVAPNRIHKIQAKNFYRYTAATNTGNAQIWLYETTNAIEFHYGTFATWTNTSGTAQVGLRGASTGTSDVRSLAGSGATAWSSPTAGNPSTATMSLFGTNVPDSGHIYRFEPVIAPNLARRPRRPRRRWFARATRYLPGNNRQHRRCNGHGR